MNSKEATELRGLILELMKEISVLRGSELAMKRVISDLVRENAISPQVEQILARYQTYRDEEVSAAHIHVEAQFPDLAAELDHGRDDPPEPPNDKHEDDRN